MRVLDIIIRLKGSDDGTNLDPDNRCVRTCSTAAPAPSVYSPTTPRPPYPRHVSFGDWEFVDMSPGSDLFELDLVQYGYALKVLYGCLRHNYFAGGSKAIIHDQVRAV